MSHVHRWDKPKRTTPGSSRVLACKQITLNIAGSLHRWSPITHFCLVINGVLNDDNGFIGCRFSTPPNSAFIHTHTAHIVTIVNHNDWLCGNSHFFNCRQSTATPKPISLINAMGLFPFGMPARNGLIRGVSKCAITQPLSHCLFLLSMYNQSRGW